MKNAETPGRLASGGKRPLVQLGQFSSVGSGPRRSSPCVTPMRRRLPGCPSGPRRHSGGHENESEASHSKARALLKKLLGLPSGGIDGEKASARGKSAG